MCALRRDPLQRPRGGSAARPRQAREEVVVDGELRMHQSPRQRRRPAPRRGGVDHAHAPAASRQGVRAGGPGQAGADHDGTALARVWRRRLVSPHRVARRVATHQHLPLAGKAGPQFDLETRVRAGPRARHARCTRWRHGSRRAPAARSTAAATRPTSPDCGRARSHRGRSRRRRDEVPARSPGHRRTRASARPGPARTRTDAGPRQEAATARRAARRGPAVRAAPRRRTPTPAADAVRSTRSAAGPAGPDRRATRARSRGS